VSVKVIDIRGRKAAIAEGGAGRPLLYLHGFADVHSVKAGFQPFHEQLGKTHRVIAPAHPGCAASDELSENFGIEDVVFHTLEVIDALGLDQFDLVGHCVGGWVAAELAVRHPEKIRKLVLIDACGLFVSGEPTGDVFMHAQAERGTDYSTLRDLLFAGPDTPVGNDYIPDGRGETEDEVRRYEMLRFGSFVGFKPPYFYHHALRGRLPRAAMPAAVIWGEHDHMVPRAHAEAFAEGLPGAKGVSIVKGAGHSVPVEAPDAAAALVGTFLS
jgi:pimeloyl-ACP methyl ester carboxylesterase